MEKNNFVTLCLRLMAIYFGVLGLGSFPNALQVSVSVGLSYSDIDKIPRAMRYLPRHWSYLIGPVIKFVISIVLIIGPDKVIGLLSRFVTGLSRGWGRRRIRMTMMEANHRTSWGNGFQLYPRRKSWGARSVE